MNILRFLICSGRLGGPQRISTRQMTVADDLLHCYSYVCQDKAEFDKLSREYVAKQNKRFWGDVDVFNTVTGKRSKVTEVIGVLLAEGTAPAVPKNPAPVTATPEVCPPSLSQTPKDSQSGGEQSPAESEGTLSKDEFQVAGSKFQEPEHETSNLKPETPDFAADLAANGAPVPEAADVGAGQEQEAETTLNTVAAAPPTSTPPAKAAKPAQPATKKKGK